MAAAVFSNWLNVWVFASWIPPQSPFAEIIKELVFIDMERGPLRQLQGEQRRGEGGFLPFRNFHVLFFLKRELAGCDFMFCRRGLLEERCIYSSNIMTPIKAMKAALQDEKQCMSFQIFRYPFMFSCSIKTTEQLKRGWDLKYRGFCLVLFLISSAWRSFYGWAVVLVSAVVDIYNLPLCLLLE